MHPNVEMWLVIAIIIVVKYWWPFQYQWGWLFGLCGGHVTCASSASDLTFSDAEADDDPCPSPSKLEASPLYHKFDGCILSYWCLQSHLFTNSWWYAVVISQLLLTISQFLLSDISDLWWYNAIFMVISQLFMIFNDYVCPYDIPIRMFPKLWGHPQIIQVMRPWLCIETYGDDWGSPILRNPHMGIC